MKKGAFILLLSLLCNQMVCEAKVTLTSLWGDNMVIQRNSEVLFWGSATGKSVEITPSWSDKSYTAKVKKDGKWSIKIKTEDAGGPYSICYDDGDKIIIENVLLGDVWLCMGQSNMAIPMRGNTGQPIAGSAQMITEAKESQPLRLFAPAGQASATPQEDMKAAWVLNSPRNVAMFSATAYFFGQKLQQTLDVPIGLVSVNKGGTLIEAWMSREALSEVKECDFSMHDRGEVPSSVTKEPCFLYNGMVAPLKGLTIKGALWFQCEGNRYARAEYLELFPRMVKGLRELLDCGEFPLYFAQMAPVGTNPELYDEVLMREAMTKLMDLTPRTGMITLTDVGEEFSVHPRFKREVGERFALWALTDAYDRNYISCRVPEYSSMEVVTNPRTKRSAINLKFKYAHQGLSFNANQASSNLFEIAGEDRVFYPANNRLNRKAVEIQVWSDSVPSPVAVRYAFKNFVIGDIFNNYGLPISSFRTDDWELPVQSNK